MFFFILERSLFGLPVSFVFSSKKAVDGRSGSQRDQPHKAKQTAKCFVPGTSLRAPGSAAIKVAAAPMLMPRPARPAKEGRPPKICSGQTLK